MAVLVNQQSGVMAAGIMNLKIETVIVVSKKRAVASDEKIANP
jgi:hypothetical protein